MIRRYELRNRNNKPHITMIRPGVWHAESRFVVMYGDTPLSAYYEWAKVYEVYKTNAKGLPASIRRRKKVDG